ncbi:MAG TPA: DUF4845 domain-containing protein [Paraburkholderia sp.]
MRSARNQNGLSMLWFLFVMSVVLVVALIGFRVLPAYIEYFTVQKALGQALSEVQNVNDTTELRRNFQRKVDAGYIDSVDGRSIDVDKDGNKYVATIEWTRKLPLVGNASLLLEFQATASR